MQRLFRLLLIGVALAPTSAGASALERVPPVSDAVTTRECGECHMAFPPALLPVESWRRIIDGLADHFGENAEVPAETAAHIRDYLTANAGRIGDPRVDRISEQPWFTREHRYSPSVWERPDVRSKANCPACHPRAELGLFEDD